MPIAKKVCRVCGKEYEACRSAKRDFGVFHWQEVACSPECGTEYLRLVNEARNPVKKEQKVSYRVKRKEEEAIVKEDEVTMTAISFDNNNTPSSTKEAK